MPTLLEYKLREYYSEKIVRAKCAETLRYVARFSTNDTAKVYLNLRADIITGKVSHDLAPAIR